MILGIGIDIVKKERINKILKGKLRKPFLKKILSSQELLSIEEDKIDIVSFCAKRFAAKEAACKAIGCGIGYGQVLKHITVLKNELGKPFISLDDAFLSILRKNKVQFADIYDKFVKIHLSISDEEDYAVANVAIEKNSA